MTASQYGGFYDARDEMGRLGLVSILGCTWLLRDQERRRFGYAPRS